MNTLSYKTVSANSATVNKEWVLIDAENEVLGRLATKAANVPERQVQDQLHTPC